MSHIDWGENLNLKISMLPDSPGCYLMKDKNQVIIYVGKAVNLKNRVRSYFRDTYHTPKVAAMISHIADFDILLCESNLEALCLECNLIKEHKPYYNILLKDDKHYPYIKLDLHESFPRLRLARRMESDGAKYYGPYIGASAVKQVIETVRDVFPIRSCSLSFPLKKPVRPCINYDMGKCLAPCSGYCSEETYNEMISGVLSFLGGDYDQVLSHLKNSMNASAAKMDYEKAAVFRDKIKDVQGLMERQIAIRTDLSEQDILGIAQDGLDAMVQILYVRGGKMLGGDHFSLPGEGGENPGEVLLAFLTQYYESGPLIPRNVLVQTLPPDSQTTLEDWLRQQKGSAVSLRVPQRGEKHDLVLLAEKNANDALKKRNARTTVREERTVGAAKNLAQILGLQCYPRRIEGYDISNTQGVYSVGSMVVFIDGESAKKEYRQFRIRTVEGANDFASLHEVLSRRFMHGFKEREEREAAGLSPKGGKFSDLPDLILIDGGPQQVRFARDAMLALGADIPMFGLAEREEEIYLPGREDPIRLDHHTPELQLVQRIRDEAHRMAITHHRAIRGNAFTHSQLEDIPGIGPARRKALLKHFGSMKAIRAASMEELMKVKGMSASSAQAVFAWANAPSAPDAPSNPNIPR
ncbi:MAG: excinuclease ABC subunit UvrC [Clostridiales bacterium]|nr:excinuclease ABC subunit UvrC [Clostridiales bacterium]